MDLSAGEQAPGTLLPRSFFLPPPDLVASRLIGKLLVRRMDDRVLAGRIVETEAYFGSDDPAAHASAGKTPRNAVLFGPPGHAYVYFIYGMHQCLNVSCEPDGKAGSVLLRALEPVCGVAEMALRRKLGAQASPRLIASGPGKLCQALGVTRALHNGVDMLQSASDLQVRDDGFAPDGIITTTRIGITKAAERPLRFLLAGSPFISAPAAKK